MPRATAGAESGADLVEAYLRAQPEPTQVALRSLRQWLRQRLPRAEEGIAYGVPAMLLDGTAVAGYGGFASHCSYFPMSGAVIDTLSDELAGYDTAKGTIRFQATRPLPARLLTALINARLAELSAVRNGLRREYFPDGTLKARGQMRDGELHGAWEWFRRDGSLKRSGHFIRGAQTGSWKTFDATGRLVKDTDMTPA
jgi:uncharacterized protein YdhG (YjbR/CyaY superfamily)